MKIFGICDFTSYPTINSSFQKDWGNKLQTYYAIYYLNPSFQYQDINATDCITKDKCLYLVDDSEDEENILLRNMILPAQKVKSILIIDSGVYDNNYSNVIKLKYVINFLRLYDIEYLLKICSSEFQLQEVSICSWLLFHS